MTKTMNRSIDRATLEAAYEREVEVFTQHHPRSQEMFARAAQSLPGGNTRTGVHTHPLVGSGDQRPAHGPRLHRARAHGQVRGRLPRPRRPCHGQLSAAIGPRARACGSAAACAQLRRAVVGGPRGRDRAALQRCRRLRGADRRRHAGRRLRRARGGHGALRSARRDAAHPAVGDVQRQPLRADRRQGDPGDDDAAGLRAHRGAGAGGGRGSDGGVRGARPARLRGHGRVDVPVFFLDRPPPTTARRRPTTACCSAGCTCGCSTGASTGARAATSRCR